MTSSESFEGAPDRRQGAALAQTCACAPPPQVDVVETHMSLLLVSGEQAPRVRPIAAPLASTRLRHRRF